MGRIRLRIEPPGSPPFESEYDGSLVLGRSTQATVPIPDGSLSRQHARLFEREGHWYVEDLGSRNATLLNGRLVTEPTRLRPEDDLRLAGTRVVVLGDPALPRAEPKEPGLSGIVKPASALLDVGGSATLTGGEGAALRRVTDRLKLLSDVHKALARPLSVDELLDLILERAFAHFRPEEGSIFLRRPGGELYRAKSQRRPGETGEPFYSRRLIREVADEGKAALVEDAGRDERFAASESMLGVRSLLAAPLLDDAGSAGMIVLHSRAHVRHFTEDDLELLVSLASAAALRLKNLALAEETARRRLLDKELELAHAIQMGMLPREFPKRPEFELFARLRPARSVGGDLYDFLLVDDHLWLIVGDVSGKGVGAALFMAVTRTLFRAVAPGEASLAGALSRMNRELARDNERSMFVTAFLARLDLRSGGLEYANAGHNLPYRLAAGSGPLPIEGARGLPLGAFAESEYTTEHLRLDPGELLFLHTDGIVEAFDAGGQAYGEARLEETLRGLSGRAAEEVVEGTLASLAAFVAGAPASDDITVMALRLAQSVSSTTSG